VGVEAAWVAEVAGQRNEPITSVAERIAEDVGLSEVGARRYGARSGFRRRSVLAAALLQQIRKEAAGGEPTADEISAMSAERFVEVDLGEQREVVHAVALVRSATDEAAARSLAERVRVATVDGPSDAFEERARSLAAEGGPELRVERLPPFVADGRIAVRGAGNFEPAFVAAAFALDLAHPTSPVVRTPFGFHVIRLLAVHAPRVLPHEERVRLFRDDIEQRRMRAELTKLLADAEKAHPTSVLPYADELLGERLTSEP
jgi:hypothetical protein